MCGNALKSEVAFQEEATHEIHVGHIVGVLRSLIQKLGETPEQFVRRSGRDFTMPWTLSFEMVISRRSP